MHEHRGHALYDSEPDLSWPINAKVSQQTDGPHIMASFTLTKALHLSAARLLPFGLGKASRGHAITASGRSLPACPVTGVTSATGLAGGFVWDFWIYCKIAPKC